MTGYVPLPGRGWTPLCWSCIWMGEMPHPFTTVCSLRWPHLLYGRAECMHSLPEVIVDVASANCLATATAGDVMSKPAQCQHRRLQGGATNMSKRWPKCPKSFCGGPGLEDGAQGALTGRLS